MIPIHQYEIEHIHRQDNLCKGKNIIEIGYRPLLAEVDIENATYIAIAFSDGVTENLCLECSKKAFEYLDFSILNSFTGYPDKNDI